mgnify:FL=1
MIHPILHIPVIETKTEPHYYISPENYSKSKIDSTDSNPVNYYEKNGKLITVYRLHTFEWIV